MWQDSGTDMCKDCKKLQQQRDQVCHLLDGGTLTTNQVKRSGLGEGVLIEQRHLAWRMRESDIDSGTRAVYAIIHIMDAVGRLKHNDPKKEALELLDKAMRILQPLCKKAT